jgi:4-amino-4-deoxy-L-arabinose transferase-like glycosyltransferase
MVAVLNLLFSLGLLAVVLLLCAALGLKAKRWLRINGLTGTEVGIFSLALGLGMIAYSVFALGLLGLLHAWALAGCLAVWGLFAWRETAEILAWLRGGVLNRAAWRQLTLDEKLLLILGGAVFLFSLVQALTPAWDYDGLMYHLQGPRLFLQAGRFYPIPENWLTFYPFTVEMLFTVGLALGSEAFTKLLHLAFAVLLALATYTAARRFAGRGAAWLATAILVGMPIYPIWASFAYSDMAWALYEFLGVYALIIYFDRQPGNGYEGQADFSHGRRGEFVRAQAGWLILAGILAGLALGVKYMALGGAASLGLVALWKSRQAGWRAMLAHGAIFSATALLVGSPWYLKNWLWTGNPVYPFYLSPGGVLGERVALWMDYMNGFGAPRTLIGYLLLPVLLYTQYTRFGTFMGSIEIPSLLFPFALLYPLVRRTPALSALAGWAVLRFLFWAAAAQQTRFLLPLFPALSILAAYVLVSLAGRLRGVMGRALLRGLGFGMLAVALVYSLLFFADVQPFGVMVGAESREAFLSRKLHLYPALQEIQSRLPSTAQVWLLWDGRGYLCDQRCVADIDQSQWTQVAMHSWDVQQTAEELRRRGVTHLLVSLQDANFIAQFERSGRQLRAVDFLVQDFMPACTRELYQNKYYRLLELTCP